MEQKDEVMQQKPAKGPVALLGKFKKGSPKAESGEKSGEEAAAKPRKPINVRSLLLSAALVLGLSAVLSVAALFALDLTGWRSSVRDSVVDLLIAKEKQAIEASLTQEFDDKLAEALESALADERAALETEKQQIKDRESELDDLETQARQRELDASNALEEAQTQQQQAKALMDQAQGQIIEVSELCALYEAMDPENAAAIMEEMEDQQLVLQIITQMKKDTAAAILEVMEKEKAADILSRIGS